MSRTNKDNDSDMTKKQFTNATDVNRYSNYRSYHNSSKVSSRTKSKLKITESGKTIAKLNK